MIKANLVLLSFLLCLQANAQSETATSTSKMGILKPKEFEADKNITDSKIIADSGSLSRYSLKFNLVYLGPPIGDLNNEMQPNPDGSAGVYETTISGAVSARYRLDSSSALNMGTGVAALTPVQGVSRYDVKNPFLSYDRTSRVADLQMRNSYGVSVVTNPVYRSFGEYAGLTYDNSLVNNLGASGFAVGMDSSFAYYLFERGYQKSDGRVSRYNLAFYPQVKYNFSDKANVYSSLALSFVNPNAMTDYSVLLNKTLSQRLGMGYAFTRDIYLAPYLNFYPEKLSPDLVTVNLSTTFSLL
jgi:hypothetical protein